MASTYNNELDKTKQQAAASTSTDLAEQTASKTGGAASYTAQLQELTGNGGAYTPSQNVVNAQNYLQNIIDNKPGSYESKYTNQLQGLYDQIMNRDKFSYDINGDMLYQQYKDQYQLAGRNAMMDTMGQAAAMTGGYGSSYANSVGQQAYQGYMQQLNSMVPELYSAAYSKYAQEGEDMRNAYSMAQAADQQDYSRWQDSYNTWANERSFAQSAYDTAYNQDYTDYTNRLNAAMQTINMEREDSQIAQQTAYNTAMAMIQKGTLPSAEMLATAGISDADALALAKKYGYREPKTYSGSSSSKKKNSSSGNSNTSGNGSGSTTSLVTTAANALKAIFNKITSK